MNDIEGPGPGSGSFFLFYVLPFLFWLLGRYIITKEKKRNKTDLDTQEKEKNCSDKCVKEWSKEKKEKEFEDYSVGCLDCKSCSQKTLKVAKYQQWVVCSHCKSVFQNSEWTPPQAPAYKVSQTNSSNSEKNGLNDKFPELTEAELEEANWILNGTKFTECPCCKHKDLITNFQLSAAGNIYRKCNKCGTNFQFSKSMIELQEVVYRRCFNCYKVVRVDEVCPCQV